MKQWIQKAICIGGSLIVLPVLMLYLYDMPLGAGRAVARQMELEATKQQEDIMDEKILIGILAKEIPYTYEIEAIKAQAVVERTYMARRILGIQREGAIVGYREEEMKQLWGTSYEKVYAIYQQAVEETKGELILYQDQPIEAVYHGASSGRTRDAMEVYGVEVPYLKGVSSTEDRVSTQMKYSKQEVIERIKARYETLAVDATNLQDEIQIVEKDEGGYVLTLQIGNVTMKGETFRKLMALPSSAFKIHNAGEKLLFDIRGNGNGVGLSQNGANEMAKQGKTYHQIITHYFTDVEIKGYEFQK